MKKLLSLLSVLLFAFTIAASQPQVLFSPHGGIRDRIIKACNLSKASIDVAIFDFTSGDLADALVRAKDRGIALRVIADPKRGADRNSETPFLHKKGVSWEMVKMLSRLKKIDLLHD